VTSGFPGILLNGKTQRELQALSPRKGTASFTRFACVFSRRQRVNLPDWEIRFGLSENESENKIHWFTYEKRDWR
jgi:hypothetical protein